MGEDEMVELTKYAFAVIVQSINKMDEMKQDGLSSMSANDVLGQYGLSTSDVENFKITDLFSMFGGDQSQPMRRKRNAQSCTCSGYNNAFFLKNSKKLVTTCVGAVGVFSL